MTKITAEDKTKIISVLILHAENCHNMAINKDFQCKVCRILEADSIESLRIADLLKTN